MSTSVAVSHDDGIAGANKALLWEDCVANTIGANIKEVPNLVTMSPITEHLTLQGCLGVLGGSYVVNYHFDFGGIKNPVLLFFHQVGNGHRCGDFMTKNPVKLENPGIGKRFLSHVGIKNLLGNGLSHNFPR